MFNFQPSLIHRLLAVLVLAALMTLPIPSIAQDDDSLETWPVQQRCAESPALPPDDWSYPGTILMSGYAGIHGMRADWETPHIVAFFRKDSRGGRQLMGGQLSPDGRWYAVPTGETYVGPYASYK